MISEYRFEAKILVPRSRRCISMLSGLMLAIVIAMPAFAQPKSKTGSALGEKGLVHFKGEAHKLSQLSVLCKRFGWTMKQILHHEPKASEYKAGDQEFTAVVPEAYDSKKPIGVFVWISPSDGPWSDPTWIPIFKKHYIIAVTPHHAGNGEFVWQRMRLALDGLAALENHYELDSSRIFIAGASGGGRLASALGLHYSDVFSGGYYMAGMNWCYKVRGIKDKKRSYPAQFDPPPSTRWTRTRRRVRHVVFCGEKCFNRDHAYSIFKDMKRRKFAHVKWQELPKAGHVAATAKLLDEGLKFLTPPTETAGEKTRRKKRGQ